MISKIIVEFYEGIGTSGYWPACVHLHSENEKDGVCTCLIISREVVNIVDAVWERKPNEYMLAAPLYLLAKKMVFMMEAKRCSVEKLQQVLETVFSLPVEITLERIGPHGPEEEYHQEALRDGEEDSDDEEDPLPIDEEN